MKLSTTMVTSTPSTVSTLTGSARPELSMKPSVGSRPTGRNSPPRADSLRRTGLPRGAAIPRSATRNARFGPSGERRDRVAASSGREDVGEVGVERAALQPAGLIDREQSFDRALAALRAAAEGELAVDDGGAQAALGGVVGRLHVGNVGERPECRPELQEVLRERAHVPLPLAGRAPLEQRPHLRFDRRDALSERVAVAVLLELLPSLEDVPGDLESVEAERLLLSRAEVGVEGEVSTKMRPAHLPALRLEAVVGAEAIRADTAREAVADEAVQVLLAAVGRAP